MGTCEASGAAVVSRILLTVKSFVALAPEPRNWTWLYQLCWGAVQLLASLQLMVALTPGTPIQCSVAARAAGAAADRTRATATSFGRARRSNEKRFFMWWALVDLELTVKRPQSSAETLRRGWLFKRDVRPHRRTIGRRAESCGHGTEHGTRARLVEWTTGLTVWTIDQSPLFVLVSPAAANGWKRVKNSKDLPASAWSLSRAPSWPIWSSIRSSSSCCPRMRAIIPRRKDTGACGRRAVQR